MDEKENNADILTELKQQLETLNIPVCYGVADNKAVKSGEYIVFGRNKISVNQNNTAHTKRFEIVLVAENWVTENRIVEVIQCAKKVGLKVSKSTDIEIEYLSKNDLSYELVSIPFFKAEKECY